MDNVDLIKMSMEGLYKHLNEVVTCIYWEKGECRQLTGVLLKADPYDRVVIDNNEISFVGTERAIEELRNANYSFYYNPKVKGFQGSFIADHLGLVNNQLELLGRSVKLEAMNNAYDSAPPEMIVSEIKGGRGYRDH